MKNQLLMKRKRLVSMNLMIQLARMKHQAMNGHLKNRLQLMKLARMKHQAVNNHLKNRPQSRLVQRLLRRPATEDGRPPRKENRNQTFKGRGNVESQSSKASVREGEILSTSISRN